MFVCGRAMTSCEARPRLTDGLTSAATADLVEEDAADETRRKGKIAVMSGRWKTVRGINWRRSQGGGDPECDTGGRLATRRMDDLLHVAGPHLSRFNLNGYVMLLVSLPIRQGKADNKARVRKGEGDSTCGR